MTQERSEPKVVLLMRLLNGIDEGRHTFEELKARISDGRSPSTRSLRRYLSVLSDAGFPWYFDRASRTYRFAEGYGLRRLALSSSELAGLLALRRLGTSLGGKLGRAVDEVTEKLVGSADRRVKHAMSSAPSITIRLPGTSLDPAHERDFETLEVAQRNGRRAAFSYVDKNGRRSERIVDPYGFVVSSGRVYLIGFDRGRTARRVFALDNISEAKILPATFHRPADFNLEAFAANSISGVMYSDSVAPVTVRFSPIVARAATAARVVGNQTVTHQPDGSVEITYLVGDPLEVVRWSLGWGVEAEVVAPEEVRLAAREIARRIAERYET